LFKAQTRMGFECTSRPTTATTQYQRIDIIGSTFEPQGSQAVSYDGGGGAGNCTFSGNVIQGAGNDPAQEFGAGFEINGPSRMTVTDNRIYACRGSLLNLQMHTSADCGWTFSGNVFDASTKLQATAMSSSSQVVLAFNVYGGTFPGNTMISAAPGGGVAYLSGSQNMDWRTSTWRDASGRSGHAAPTQVGCGGNQF
ncbi:MAG TPA: right-handed parallel beta-helix repeat-containing protein, partial [Thermoleophilia bacterium]